MPKNSNSKIGTSLDSSKLLRIRQKCEYFHFSKRVGALGGIGMNSFVAQMKLSKERSCATFLSLLWTLQDTNFSWRPASSIIGDLFILFCIEISVFDSIRCFP